MEGEPEGGVWSPSCLLPYPPWRNFPVTLQATLCARRGCMEAIVAQLASESEELHQVAGWGGQGSGRALQSVPLPEAPADRAPSPMGVMGVPSSLCSPTTCGVEGRGEPWVHLARPTPCPRWYPVSCATCPGGLTSTARRC